MITISRNKEVTSLSRTKRRYRHNRYTYRNGTRLWSGVFFAVEFYGYANQAFYDV